MSLSLPRGWWGYHWSPPHPRSIVELIRARTLDAELAAELWLLIEARVPILVAARPPLAGKSTTLTALLDFLSPDARLHVLRGATETFAWLPEAASLGWVDEPGWPSLRPQVEPVERADADCSYLLAGELSAHLPIYTWGRAARVAIRATSVGYGLATTMHADSLAGVFAELQAPPVGLTEDELRGLGVVLVLRMYRPDGSVLDPTAGGRDTELAPLDASVRRRIVAAHYVRPIERDGGGHLQRRPPAVLATWNARTDSLDHFAWGIVPELAVRVGRSAAEFEREQTARAEFLAGLARDGVTEIDDVRGALRTYRDGRSEHAPVRLPAAARFRTDLLGGRLTLPPKLS